MSEAPLPLFIRNEILSIPKSRRASGGEREALKLESCPQVFIRKLRFFGPLEVWLVNGMLLRNRVFLNFTEGGNSACYSWLRQVPPIIILDASNLLESKFILIHEFREFNGILIDGMYYDESRSSAHEYANKHEQLARDNPDMADELIQLEADRWMKFCSQVGH